MIVKILLESKHSLRQEATVHSHHVSVKCSGFPAESSETVKRFASKQPERPGLQTSTSSSAASGSKLTAWSHSWLIAAGGSDWSAGPSAVCPAVVPSVGVSSVDRTESTLSGGRSICAEVGCGTEAAGTSWLGPGRGSRSVWGGWSGGGVVPDSQSAGEPVSHMVTCKHWTLFLWLSCKKHKRFFKIMSNHSFYSSVARKKPIKKPDLCCNTTQECCASEDRQNYVMECKYWNSSDISQAFESKAPRRNHPAVESIFFRITGEDDRLERLNLNFSSYFCQTQSSRSKKQNKLFESTYDE